MGRRYTARIAGLINGPIDLFEITAPTSAIVVIHAWEIAQVSDVGVAQEEVLRLVTIKGVGAVTSGSGGSTIVPHPIHNGDPNFAGVVEWFNQTLMAAGTGALKELRQLAWNVRLQYEHCYEVARRPVIAPGDRWVLRAPVAPSPADLLDIRATVVFEEVG